MTAARSLDAMALPSVLRSQAASLEASAAALRAVADAHERGGADAPIPLARAAEELGVSVRVLRDAARRGELSISHAGRTPMTTAGEVTRWLASRRVTTRAPVERDDAEPADERSEAREALRATAERIGR